MQFLEGLGYLLFEGSTTAGFVDTEFTGGVEGMAFGAGAENGLTAAFEVTAFDCGFELRYGDIV